MKPDDVPWDSRSRPRLGGQGSESTYDSLNVGADGAGGTVGHVIDPNGIFVNPSNTNYLACGGTGTLSPNGFMQLDTGPDCWTANHPLIKVISEKRKRARQRHDNLSD
jgi:hypothetical protein